MDTGVEEEQPVTHEEKQEKPIRKRRRVYGEKVCQVCGDKALAHHFGALACETCKAFFRRNALGKDQRKCLFKSDCPINVKTRRFCPPCRLAKCFSVGMQADLILDDSEKKQRILKMNEKKSKKGETRVPFEGDRCAGMTMSHSPACSVTTTGEITYSPDQTGGMVEQAWIAASEISNSLLVDNRWSQGGPPINAGQNVEVVLSKPEGVEVSEESKHMLFSGRKNHVPPPTSVLSPYPPTPVASVSSVLYASERWPSTSPAPTSSPTTSETCSQDKPSNSLAGQLQFTTTFRHVPREELPSDPYMYWRLSEEERSLLMQLSAAYQDTVLSVLQGSPPRETISNQLVTHELYLQECELEAGNAVSFAKRMEDFRQLRLDEQIALLKASTCQVLGLRGCALYVAEKDAWLTSKGYFTPEHYNRLIPNYPHFDVGLNFCRNVKSIVKNDVTLYALLHCVVLFDPSDERIIDRQLINSIRDKYIILLRHYLESVYSYAHSEKYLMALQENLIFQRSLCLEEKPLIKKFFPSIPNKLLIEVLDLD